MEAEVPTSLWAGRPAVCNDPWPGLDVVLQEVAQRLALGVLDNGQTATPQAFGPQPLDGDGATRVLPPFVRPSLSPGCLPPTQVLAADKGRVYVAPVVLLVDGRDAGFVDPAVRSEVLRVVVEGVVVVVVV